MRCNSVSRSILESDPSGEGPTVAYWHRPKVSYGLLSAIYLRFYLGANEPVQRIVVCCMAFNLQLYKCVRDVLYCLREKAHRGRVAALPFCKSVVDRAVCLSPRGRATLCALPADEGIRRIPAQLMKYSIVSSAHGALEVGLPWPSRT